GLPEVAVKAARGRAGTVAAVAREVANSAPAEAASYPVKQVLTYDDAADQGGAEAPAQGAAPRVPVVTAVAPAPSAPSVLPAAEPAVAANSPRPDAGIEPGKAPGLVSLN